MSKPASTPASLARDVRTLAMMLENDIKLSEDLVDWFNSEMDYFMHFFLGRDPRVPTREEKELELEEALYI